MKWCLVLVGCVAFSIGTLGQTTVVIDETFELADIDTSTWTWSQSLAGNFDLNWDSADHGQVLRVHTTGAEVARIGALYTLNPFSSDDVLVTQLDVKEYTDNSYFTIEPGSKYGGTGGTSIPPVIRALPGMAYHPGMAGDPYYPNGAETDGFAVQVENDGVADNPGLSNYPCPPGVTTGDWMTIRMINTPDLMQFVADDTVHLELAGDDLYYKFDRIDDWLLLLGDGGSKSWSISYGVSFDNVLVLQTKESILAAVDKFGVSFATVDPFYTEFGAEQLSTCVTNSGSWEECQDCLGGTDVPYLHCEMEIAELASRGSHLLLEIENAGTMLGIASVHVSAGLAYSDSWLPETDAIFMNEVVEYKEIAARSKAVIEVDLNSIPESVIEGFLAKIPDVYTDPDLDMDYIAVTVTIDGCIGSDKRTIFIPFDATPSVLSGFDPSLDTLSVFNPSGDCDGMCSFAEWYWENPPSDLSLAERFGSYESEEIAIEAQGISHGWGAKHYMANESSVVRGVIDSLQEGGPQLISIRT